MKLLAAAMVGIVVFSMRLFPIVISFFLEALWKPKVSPNLQLGSEYPNTTSSTAPTSGGIPLERPEPWTDT